ncbi:MAG: hypothetical protein HOP07_16365 [Bacteriovoracaceae bacterium]|nr:hypothetical protein [Bacteriovoracaceae bacterium]
MKKYMIICFLLSTKLIAASLPQNKSEFCSRYDDLTIMSDMGSAPQNLMSFKNQGGIFNGGVCWWHSRFQRNILYLSQFRPDLPRINPKELKPLIKEIRAGKSIVIIPGFSNFEEFSETYKKEILKELEAWQIYDGVVLGKWVDGLKGETKIEVSLLKQKMDELYNYVQVNKKIAYQKLQIKGITSHSWLIVKIKKLDSGYDLALIDSNNPKQTENYSYKIGDESFFDKSYGNFVPYLEFTREEIRLDTIAKAYCDIVSPLAQDTVIKNYDADYEADLLDIKLSQEY